METLRLINNYVTQFGQNLEERLMKVANEPEDVRGDYTPLVANSVQYARRMTDVSYPVDYLDSRDGSVRVLEARIANETVRVIDEVRNTKFGAFNGVLNRNGIQR